MNKECSIQKASNFLGKRWTLNILLEMYKGKEKWKRYSHIKNRILKITPKMLSMRLKELEREGLVDKRIDTKIFPIKCEYMLTKSGEDFIHVVKELKNWSLKWKGGSSICKNTNCKYCNI